MVPPLTPNFLQGHGLGNSGFATHDMFEERNPHGSVKYFEDLFEIWAFLL
jgi:hypothetical protein